MVITDINLFGENGQEILVYVRENHPTMKRMCMTMHDDFETLSEVLSLGVTGYITKSSGFTELSLGIQNVYDGKIYLDQKMLGKVITNLKTGTRKKIAVTSDSLGMLTNRERQVFSLLIDNIHIDKMSERLFISIKTVENHRASIYKKLKVKDRNSLIQYAKEQNLYQ